MSAGLQPRTIYDLVRGKMYTRGGSAIDHETATGRHMVQLLLLVGWWAYDGTPITPWERRALEMLVDDRAPLDTLVPPPLPPPPAEPTLPDRSAGSTG